jgi:hypothetical protein
VGLDGSARQSLHSQFAEKCDPVADAQLAAGAMYWAMGLDGPIKAAAKRIVSLYVQAVQLRKSPAADETLEAYLDELRALTLARHAAYWVFLIQVFGPNAGSSDAVDEETTAYLPEFALNIEHHIQQMTSGRFQPTARDSEALKPWAMALSLHGRFWVDGREHGVPEATLMETLWKAAPIR